MALWAELDANNQVTRVVVGNDSDADGGYEWLVALSSGPWIETSADGSVRDAPASVGSYYCDTHDSFACQLGCDFGDFLREQRRLPTDEAARRSWFMGRPFACLPYRYVPPSAMDQMEDGVHAVIADNPARVANIGSGIGTLGVTIGAEIGAHVTFVEPESDLLATSRVNAEAHGVSASFVNGTATDLVGQFDAIISDVPCWPSNSDEVEVYGYAADGGPDGLNILRDVVAVAERCLKPNGLLALRFPAHALLVDNSTWTDVVCTNGIVVARKAVVR